MNLRRVRLICMLAAVGMAGSVYISAADIPENPYLSIVHRNPFALKEPPPPPAPQQEAPPAAPPVKVTLTGLLHMFGEPKAIFEIYDDPAKGGTPKRPAPMRVGERQGPVEVLSIDVEKNMVTIRNSNVETNLTFEVAKATGAVPIPGVPSVPTPLPMAGVHTPGAGSPTVISANGNSSGGGGVTLVGGGSTGSAPGSGPAVYGGPATPTASAAGIPSALGSDSGLRSIPSRPLRTDANSGPPMTREQAKLLISAQNAAYAVQAQQGGVAFPPIPGGDAGMEKHLIGDQGQNPTPQQPRFPSFPAVPR